MEYFKYIFEVSKLNSLKQKFGFFLKAALLILILILITQLTIKYKNKITHQDVAEIKQKLTTRYYEVLATTTTTTTTSGIKMAMDKNNKAMNKMG